MNIEYVNPVELVPYSQNAKLHPADQVEHIANSIKTFGWTQPIVVDEKNVVVRSAADGNVSTGADREIF